MAVSDSDISAFVSANIDNPQAIADAAAQYGVSAEDISRATGYSASDVSGYLSNANVSLPSASSSSPLNSGASTNYSDLVNQAYAGIGRYGAGNTISNIDQGGWNYWNDQLATGALTPDTFGAAFNNSVNSYVAEKPDDQYSTYVTAVTQWKEDNPNATPQQLADAIKAAGGLTPGISKAVANVYGTTTNEVDAAYNKLTSPLSALPQAINAANLFSSQGANTTNGIAPWASVVGPLSPSQQYDRNLFNQTDPMKSGFEKIFKDDEVSKEEADAIEDYAKLYNFKAEDISRVTGIPVEKVTQALEAAYGYRLEDQTDPLKAGIEKLWSDKTVSLEEAAEVKAYSDKYGFKAEDISRVTGVPLADVQKILAAPQEYATKAYEGSILNDKAGMNAAIADVYKDGQISFNEAKQIKEYLKTTGYKTDDITRLTGIPKETLDELTGAYDSNLANILKVPENNLFSAISIKNQEGLSNADIARLSGGRFSENELNDVEKPFTAYINAIEGKGDFSKNMQEFATYVRSDPKLQAQFAPQLEAIDNAKAFIDRHALKKDFGGEYKSYAMQMLLGLDNKTKLQAPTQLEFTERKTDKATGVDEYGNVFEYEREISPSTVKNTGVEPVYSYNYGDDGGGAALTGYRKLLDADAFEEAFPGQKRDLGVYATYDVNGKHTGYESNAHVHVNDPQWIGGKWDTEGRATPISGSNGRNSWQGFFDDTIGGVKEMVGPEIWTILKIAPPTAPYANAADAVLAASYGDWKGATVNALAAYGAYETNNAASMQDPSSVNAVNGMDLASDVATTGSSAYTQAMTNATIANMAAASIPAFDAAANGNYTQLGAVAAGAISNPLIADKFDFKTNPTAANAMYGLSGWSAYQNNDLAGMLGAASGLMKSPDLKLASVATRFFDAARSGNSESVINAANAFGRELGSNERTSAYAKEAENYINGLIPDDAKNFVKDVKSEVEGVKNDVKSEIAGVKNDVKTYLNDVKADAKELIKDLKTSTTEAADVFRNAIKSGATEDEAFAAAKLYESNNSKILWGKSAPTTITPIGGNATDATDTEFGNLTAAQNLATLRNTVDVGHDNSYDTKSVQEALEYAQEQNPNASRFFYNGKTYNISASNDAVEAMGAPTKEEIASDRLRLADDYAQSLGKKDAKELTTKEVDTFMSKIEPADQTNLRNMTLQDLFSANDSGGGKEDKSRIEISGVGDTGKETNPQYDVAKSDILKWADTLQGPQADTIKQTLSTILSGTGEQMADVGTAASNTGLVGQYNALVKAGQYLESVGQKLEIPEVTKARENFINDVQAADTYGDKVLAAAKAIANNPLVLTEVAKEGMQEIAPLLVGGTVFKLAGKLAGLGADVIANASESMGTTQRQSYNEEIAKGTSPEDALRISQNKGQSAFLITTATAALVDTALVKGYEKAVEKITTRAAANAATEYPEEGLEELLISIASGDDLNTAVSKSVIGSLVGAKTSGSISVASDAAASVNQAFADQGLTSTDGSFRPETIVAIDSAEGKIGTVASAIPSSVATAIEAGENPSTVIENSISSSVESGLSPEIAISTTVSSAVNSGVDTNVAINTAVNTAVNVGVNTDTAVKIATNAATGTGTATDTKTDTATDTTTNTNVNVDTNVGGGTGGAGGSSSTSATAATTEDKEEKKKAAALASGMPSGRPFTPPEGYIPAALKEQFLKVKGTQEAFKNPLADLFKIYGGGAAAAQGMNNIDPQLASLLSQRTGAPQESGINQMGGGIPAGQLGAPLSQTTGTPYSESKSYFTYGQEDDIDELLGRPKRPVADPAGLKMADGGYVQPLALAPGGLTAPLMAATGGLPSKAQGREDFRTSKHVAGEGDGHSDDIPAMLADGEFVFSADVVSALGNGSTKAGSDKLYKMVEEIRKRARSTSPDKLAPPALKSPLDYLKKR